MRKIVITGAEKELIARNVGEIDGFKLAQITYDSNLYEPDDDDILYEVEFHPIKRTNPFELEDDKVDFIIVVDYEHHRQTYDLTAHYGYARYSSDYTLANKIYNPVASGRLSSIERIKAIVMKQLEFDKEIRRMKLELD